MNKPVDILSKLGRKRKIIKTLRISTGMYNPGLPSTGAEVWIVVDYIISENR